MAEERLGQKLFRGTARWYFSHRPFWGGGNGAPDYCMSTIGKDPSEVRAEVELPSAISARRVDAIYSGLLDSTCAVLSDPSATENRVHLALDDLFLSLQEHRLMSTEAEWRQFVTICRSHPLKAFLHEDPFTRRASEKPRGYAGDAVMMDYIYGQEERWPPPAASPLGRRIFNFTTLAPASEGVRARRAFMADVLDHLAATRERPDVLAVASGHLREASMTSAVRRRKLGRFVALDADAASLAEVRACYGPYGVETVHARFRELITGQLDVGQFDLVYSTGLFDYLAQPTGQRLTQLMFRLLRPGGKLIVANFLPGIRDIGYMEAYMDWFLVYRTRYEMLDLTIDIPQSELGNVQIFAEENQNIIMLELTRS